MEENNNNYTDKLNNKEDDADKEINLNDKKDEEQLLLDKSNQSNNDIHNQTLEEKLLQKEILNNSNINSNSSNISNYPAFCLQIPFYIIILVFFYLIFFFVEKSYERVITVKYDFQIKKPLSDRSKYKIIKLENELEVLLISDPEAAKCAASLNVGVGSFSDEKNIQGRAHLTEHLIFLGSEKFPNAGELESHLQSHGGGTNAFTDNENTAYYFDVNPLGYEKALDIFSSMLASPLFNEQNMDKEINAVSSENDKNYNNDNWRQHQLLNALGNPNSPYSLFSTGNNESLRQLDKQVLNKKIKEYFYKYYIPSNMKLVLLSNQSIDSLEDFAAKYFSDVRSDTEGLQDISKTRRAIINDINNKERINRIRVTNVTISANTYMNNTEINSNAITNNGNDNNNINKNKFIDTEKPIFSKPNYSNIIPYRKQDLSQFVWWKKISTGQSLDIIFLLPNIDIYYKSKPTTYLSYLLSYSGENSLLEVLTKNKLANKLSSGLISSKESFSLLAITVDLTKLGLAKLDTVTSLVFKYLKLVRESEIKDNIFNEIKNMEKTKFNFLDKNNDYGSYLSQLAKNLFIYDYEDVLYSDYNYENYNSTIIKTFSEKLIPENCLIFVGSDNYPKNIIFNKENSTELWYNTTYNNRSLSENEIEKLNKGEYVELTKNRNNNSKNNRYTNYNSNILENQYNSITEKTVVDNAEFILRPQNEYITSENKLISCIKNKDSRKEKEFCDNEKTDLTPVIKVNTTYINLWYKLDRSFSLPKINSYIQILSNNSNIKDHLALLIFYSYYENYININLAQAGEAGNAVDIDLNENGFYIKINSYSDVLNKITSKLLDGFYKTNITEILYADAFEITLDRLNEAINDPPYKKSQKIFKKLIKVNYYTSSELLVELKQMNFSSFKTTINKLVIDFQYNCLLHGYITEEDLSKHIDILNDNIINHINSNNNTSVISKTSNNTTITTTNNSTLPLIKNQFSLHKKIKGSIVFRQLNNLPSEINNEISNYYQVGSKDYKKSLLMSLIQLDYSNLFYSELRTKQQLGYIVFSEKTFIDGVMYFIFLVQGRTKTPDEMNLAIDGVLELVNKTRISQLKDSEFKSFKNNIKEILNKEYTNLSEKTEEIWKEIDLKTYDFTRKYKLISTLDTLTIREVQDMFEDIFFKNPNKLSVQLYSQSVGLKDSLKNSISEEYFLNKNISSIVSSDLNLFSDKEVIYRKNKNSNN